MAHHRDHNEDDETRRLEQDVQKLRDVQESKIREDAHKLDLQRVRDMMMKDPDAMQHEVQAKVDGDTGNRVDTSNESTEKGETGKVLTDEHEPGISTHVHKHKDGTTISFKDENTGKVERYNFDT